ncbi:hypothetical protein [Methylobacterium sp. 13MFTsu3.1M2]|uniref:hypothetical protein n=1 Tax=Methylobacterium sp. 13MFTsu3.1M2 TaxID=1502776 RepID=UPI000ABF2426|nr:hypothetical protein [Methylobacterium sp. 13MFTsu3.1M2]
MESLAGDKILPLREHIARIYRTAVNLNGDKRTLNEDKTHWAQMEYNLFLAQSINSISSDTSFFDPESGRYCSGWSLLDSLTSKSTDDLILANIRFMLLWTAFECLVKTWPNKLNISKDPKQNGGGALKQKEATTFKALMAKLDETLPMNLDLKRVRDEALAACRLVGDMDNGLASASMTKAGPRHKDTFSYCAELVRAFRNHVTHGNEIMPWPDNESVHAQRLDAVQQAVIDRHKHMSRILLMLMQTCLACELDESIVARAGFDDDYEEVHIPLRQFILKAHMVGCGTNLNLCYYDGPSVE